MDQLPNGKILQLKITEVLNHKAYIFHCYDMIFLQADA